MSGSTTLFSQDGDIHQTPESNTSQVSSDNTEDPKYITVDQVLQLLDPVKEGTDQKIDNYVRKHNIFILEHKVKHVNKNINTIRHYWNDITPCEMIVALDESHGDVDELAMHLLNDSFKPMIRKLVQERLQHKPVEVHEIPESDLSLIHI